MKRERVLANMVIGANGATLLNHDSAQLSPPADRTRFHEIRKMSKALVVGGRTFRLKRMRPAPQGRGYRVRKRSNHVTLIVDTKSDSKN